MGKKNSTNSKPKPEVSPVHEFIKEWKRRRMEDEKEFLQETSTPEYKKKMEALRGKIVKNGITVSAS